MTSLKSPIQGEGKVKFPIRCHNCKEVMEQDEYYGGHLNGVECLAKQKELERIWKERQRKLAEKWKRRS